MRTDNIKVTITIPIPYKQSDNKGAKRNEQAKNNYTSYSNIVVIDWM